MGMMWHGVCQAASMCLALSKPSRQERVTSHPAAGPGSVVFASTQLLTILSAAACRDGQCVSSLNQNTEKMQSQGEMLREPAEALTSQK